MKALYIHGYQSSPVKEKVDILKENFEDVFAPFIDWDDKKTRISLFKDLSNLINERGITHVIGSSMGGQMAFYLASYNDINCLAFNPAFGYRFNDLGLDLGDKKLSKKIVIALGSKDTVIPSYTSIKFLYDNHFRVSENLIVNVLPIGHQIDLDTFRTQIGNLI
jgi:pimeloyl-ACP methyl ester carboxylesterase